MAAPYLCTERAFTVMIAVPVLLQMMPEHIAGAPDSLDLMQTWLQAHTALLGAIRVGDAEQAARRIRQDLFDHYEMHVAPERRVVVEQMLRFGS